VRRPGQLLHAVLWRLEPLIGGCRTVGFAALAFRFGAPPVSSARVEAKHNGKGILRIKLTVRMRVLMIANARVIGTRPMSFFPVVCVASAVPARSPAGFTQFSAVSSQFPRSFLLNRATPFTIPLITAHCSAVLALCTAPEVAHSPSWPAICVGTVEPLQRIALQLRLTNTFKEVA
jgi:hypothetical protein